MLIIQRRFRKIKNKKYEHGFGVWIDNNNDLQKLCQICNKNIINKVCKQCNLSLFCQNCYTEYHKGSKRNHTFFLYSKEDDNMGNLGEKQR